MLDHIGQGLLHDPVRGKVDARGQVPRLPAAGHVDPDARARGTRKQPVQVGQPGSGEKRHAPAHFAVPALPARWPGRGAAAGLRGHVLLVRLAQGAQHPAHLVQGLPAGRLDGPEGVARAGRLGVDDVLAVACLDRDDAHAVRHHVVQFAGDAQAFLRDRLARRLVLQPDRVPAPLPHDVAGEPRDDHAQRDGDQPSVREDSASGQVHEHGVGHQGGENGGEHAHRSPPAFVGRRHQVEHIGNGQEVGDGAAGLRAGQHGDDE